MYHPYYPLHHQPQQQQQQRHPPPPTNAPGSTSFLSGNPLGLAGPTQRIHPPPLPTTNPGPSSSSSVHYPHPNSYLSPHYAPPRPLPLVGQPRLHPPLPFVTSPFLYDHDPTPLEGPSSFAPLTYTPPLSALAPGSSFNPAVFRPAFYYPLPPTPTITTPPLTDTDVNALGLMRMDEPDELEVRDHAEQLQVQLPQVQEEGEEEISPALTAGPIHFDNDEEHLPVQSQPEKVEVEAKEEEHGEHDDADAEAEIEVNDQEGDDDEYAPPASVKKGKTKAKGKVKSKKAKGRGRAKGKAKGKGKKKTTTTTATSATAGRRAQQPLPSSASTDSSMCIPPSHTGWDGDSDDDILYALRNVQWPLMPCTEGSLLEVNDLLILHPPALSPSHKNSHRPTNQYSRNTPVTADPGQSMFEMYTCRACRKTYDGKNARSVARRHLQDKHGIPLSKQARRTRWDLDSDRPKDAFEANERSKKCKRDWAKVSRQQRALEKLHAEFLLQFGPNGLKTTWKHSLLAPVFREIPPPLVDDNVVWKQSDQVAIPPSIIESVKVLADYESCVEQDRPVPFVSFDDLLHLDEGFECASKAAYAVQLDTTLSSGSIISTSSSNRPHRPTPHYDPYTSTPGSVESADSQAQGSQLVHLQHGPSPSTQAQSSFAHYIPDQLIPDSVSDQHIYDLLAAEAAQLEEPTQHIDHANADTEGDEEEEQDGPPPLLYEVDWQHWSHDIPSVSNSSLARIASELGRATADVPVDEQAEAGPSGTSTDPVNHDTAAALLDMHFSPPKPARPARPTFAQPGWIDNQAQLIAEYSSRPPLSHTKSLSASVKQTFLHRPGHMQRSLSTATLLDDPFVLDQNRAQGTTNQGEPSTYTNANSPGRGKVGRVGMSSPLSARKRKPLSALHSDTNVGFTNTNTPQPHSRSYLSNSARDSGHHQLAKHQSGLDKDADAEGDRFVTPARPSSRSHSSLHPPASVDKWLNLSSPADPAASLGLVPTHAVPTTPGLSMIIGQDTPRPLLSAGGAAGKRRRTVGAGAVTPSIR